MDAYKEFAYIYDTLMHDVDYSKWMDFIKDILIAYNVKSQEVLEIGCGTGNFTRLLCEAGYKVTAFDLSEDMLSIAYDKLNSYRNIQLLNQDMTDFNINKSFEAIISVCDSINYLVDYLDLEKCFNRVYSHLEPGGIFVFDINSFYKLKHIIGNNTFIEDNEAIFYVWENEFFEEDNTCEFYITFFVKSQDLYKRFDEVHIEKAYTYLEIEKTLKKAGFENINVYDDYSNKLPTETSERLIFVAQK
ncbi:Methyltransferase domain-containing protein [Proteiniborus ethanoligenes]|uniref:Methyltransferase domain-containing protein n=1 Tax=Proteiniborus ethanoligenes TaxID=415015 RepID=A0A1H3SRT2_9FIRM|nr:class I SAM-dependent methyltransferase [Proteiniborus ethanoligenes]SDZ40251.1 Methyltransferase domain-containing protein [Proteiniborus ethanoligenes]